MDKLITIYHGSEKIVEQPTFGEGKKNNDFVKMFIVSSVSKRMENGEPAYLAGKSGIETYLKRIRTAYGCTQSELSERSGVSLRSIQMYEQRNKNINKASVDLPSLFSNISILESADIIK